MSAWRPEEFENGHRVRETFLRTRMAGREGTASSSFDHFTRLYIGKCEKQAAEDRFGKKVLAAIAHDLTFMSDPLSNQPPNPLTMTEWDVSEDEGEGEGEGGNGGGGTAAGDQTDQFALDGTLLPAENQPPRPKAVRARLNVTALSQRYNLYFVAYKDGIHVYEPRRPPKILKGPLIILKPRPSIAGQLCNGFIDGENPHQVNHLIIGELGDQEIILMSYDDGDVVAYYTRMIVQSLGPESGRRVFEELNCTRIDTDSEEEKRKKKRKKKLMKMTKVPKGPREFFHENVGSSAWGLAIHSKSRLIAVSSNLKEVTIFAFALTEPPSWERELFQGGDVSGASLRSGESSTRMEDRPHSRMRSWRIILSTPMSCQNMPSISFMDDKFGDAERVVATDIRACLWLFDIWKVGTAPIAIPPHGIPSLRLEPEHDWQYDGWSALVLPKRVFLPQTSLFSRFGVRNHFSSFVGRHTSDTPLYNPFGRWLDISFSMLNVPHNATHNLSLAHLGNVSLHRTRGLNITSAPLTSTMNVNLPATAGEDDDEESLVRRHVAESTHKWWADECEAQDPVAQDPATVSTGFEPEMLSGFQLAHIAIPGLCKILRQPASSVELLCLHQGAAQERRQFVESMNLDDAVRSGMLPSGADAAQFGILRGYNRDVELLSLDPDATRVLCQCVLENCNPRNRRPLWDMQFGERIQTLLYVPGLDLIVAGSLCGRVALLTPTCVPDDRASDDDSSRVAAAEAAEAAEDAADAAEAEALFAEGVQKGFRVEWVLPTLQDEAARKRPFVCLAGVAVSPIADPTARGLDLVGAMRSRSPIRYRLILNYQDHTVLTYHISRTPFNGGIELIF